MPYAGARLFGYPRVQISGGTRHPFQAQRFHLAKHETVRLDQELYIAIRPAPTAAQQEQRFQQLLQEPHSRIRAEAVIKKVKRSRRPEHAGDFFQSPVHVGYAAQRPGADDAVKGSVRKRQVFGVGRAQCCPDRRNVDSALSAGQHLPVRVRQCQVANPVRVPGDVEPCSAPDFKHLPGHFVQQGLPSTLNRRIRDEKFNNARQDIPCVDSHGHPLFCRKSYIRRCTATGSSLVRRVRLPRFRERKSPYVNIFPFPLFTVRLCMLGKTSDENQASVYAKGIARDNEIHQHQGWHRTDFL